MRSFIDQTTNFFNFLWIFSIPNSRVIVSIFRHKNSSQNGSNIEGGPLTHKLLKHLLLTEPIVPFLPHLLLHRNTSWIPDRFSSVSIVVGLHYKPVIFAQLIVSMHIFDISFDDCTFPKT